MTQSGWMADVRRAVDARLSAFFVEKRAAAARVAPECVELVISIETLTLRGGKRLRPAVLYAGYCAAGGAEDTSHCTDVGAALEVLQSYLLIHDDWMDGDDERRGGPSVHAALATQFGSRRLGDALAILAGDIASAWAWELLMAARFPPNRLHEALTTFRVVQEEVVFGQQLDLLGAGDVALMHHLKTGSYTVRGPLELGALLAGGTDAQREALLRFGQPLGIAFQLRDDLLGTFGDPSTTGKPSGNDLRAGKRTALVLAAERLLDEGALAPLRAVIGHPEASEELVRAATRLLETCGARRRVEEELERRIGEAEHALDESGLARGGRERLRELVSLLARRDR